jgi:hypothetical protein
VLKGQPPLPEAALFSLGDLSLRLLLHRHVPVADSTYFCTAIACFDSASMAESRSQVIASARGGDMENGG